MTGSAAARPTRLNPTIWLGLGCLLAASIWLFVAVQHPRGADSLHFLNRWLVRFSLPFFMLAFSASSWARLWPSPGTKRLLRERRGFGLAWAALQLTHAVAILVLFEATDESRDGVTLAFGGFGFVLTLAMALTSSDAAVRRMGARNWQRLHRFGIRYLMFIYLFTYGGAAAAGEGVWPVVALVGLLGLVGLRVASGLKMRRKSGSRGEAVAEPAS